MSLQLINQYCKSFFTHLKLKDRECLQIHAEMNIWKIIELNENLSHINLSPMF